MIVPRCVSSLYSTPSPTPRTGPRAPGRNTPAPTTKSHRHKVNLLPLKEKKKVLGKKGASLCPSAQDVVNRRGQHMMDRTGGTDKRRCHYDTEVVAAPVPGVGVYCPTLVLPTDPATKRTVRRAK